ncbi:hypothetical protein BATDEDRAFT_21274 [Batrachochytrium dendrobatidis JAM81]|uniref:Cns1/TTC4 wheel domain-containing protein n=1 Tax=Batrachochytrium dendrobatidis (strain JAM81 / FGSC 10211) TaxID=684364 RepID=F4NS63_BATDJ|nr:uncharacterized protein BATDEDRAFT_21274 [Batrachochytrium dendrobatidis JAM81]EGF82990.1 hypothetical protein BATDEDRAFT_21274 [Batrachochytrium dendrobatidis JAM81]|eukprot:XP_006675242.1 hypothetical protein BATDEDRAFT_21274 [Batrachochytrium dendrobatidis JAM81]
MAPVNLSEAISKMAAERAVANSGPNAPKRKTDDELVDEVLSTPLFMSRLSKDDVVENETLAALQSLQFDGTPREVAENFKHQGNAAFKEGPRKYKDAVAYYTKALAANAQDKKLDSILYSNRAAVNLEQGNYRQVLNDCAAAIRLDPKNIKALFRSTKALFALDRVDEGIDCCELGISIDPQNKSLHAELLKLKKKKQVLDDLDAKRKLREQLKRDQETQLQNAIAKQGYKLVQSVLPDADDDDDKNVAKSVLLNHPLAADHKIKFDATTSSLKFPVLFLYPEHKQSDFIAEFDENDTFYMHMETMFSEAAPWDPEHAYHPQGLDLLFETPESESLNGKKSLVSVLRSVTASNSPSQSAAHKYVYTTLKDALQHPSYRIVDGVCTFIVVVRDSKFSKSFRDYYCA